MAIERKDRSFDLIFDQVSMDHLPAEYLLEIVITTIDGKIVLTREDIQDIENRGKNIMSEISEQDVLDISVKLDYELIKKDVTDGVGEFLGTYFDNDK
jgi:hypothetical protein